MSDTESVTGLAEFALQCFRRQYKGLMEGLLLRPAPSVSGFMTQSRVLRPRPQNHLKAPWRRRADRTRPNHGTARCCLHHSRPEPPPACGQAVTRVVDINASPLPPGSTTSSEAILAQVCSRQAFSDGAPSIRGIRKCCNPPTRPTYNLGDRVSPRVTATN